MTSRRIDDPPDGGRVLRITTIPGAVGTVHPRHPQEIRVAASAFIDEYGPGTIVLDAIDDLTLHSGLERVLRVIDDIHEEIAMRGATLVVFADPRRTNPRTIAWLERELDPLPRDLLRPGIEDRLVV